MFLEIQEALLEPTYILELHDKSFSTLYYVATGPPRVPALQIADTC